MAETWNPKDKEALIRRRRRQVIVHSVLYYTYYKPLISDHEFDALAYELVALHKKYPKTSRRVEFAEEFKDFDGSTGYQFSRHMWGMEKAAKLLRDLPYVLVANKREAMRAEFVRKVARG